LTTKETFILELAHSMQQFGIPSHRLENSLNDVCKSIGLQATIIPNPEYVSITFFSSENPYTINKKSGRIDINFHRIVALSELVESVIQKEIPIDQALMDLGSTICTPTNPKCSTCPLSFGCRAYSQVCI
jgi:uncharacterized membrane protein YjjP (DUF1212 family)